MRTSSRVVFLLVVWPWFMACEDYYLWFPPEDFHEPLVEQTVDLERNNIVTFDLTHKYNGTYAIWLRFPDPPQLGKNIDTPLRLLMHCSGSGAPPWEKTSALPYHPFLESGGAGGLVIMAYKVPDDLPRREPLRCRIEVVTGDPALQEEHGKPQLVLRNVTTL